MNILKENGIFAFICSNKFAKAKYGEKLRKLILNNQLKIYNDYTGVKIFKEASVDTCVIQIKKAYVEDNEVHVDEKYYMEQSRLDSNSFTFNSPEILDLRDKIFNQGTLIKDLDIQINYGIKTGFNKAFIIDEETKDMLIKKDFNNKEIIKPLLRGRDIGKWKISYKNLYLIHSYDGLNVKKEFPFIFEFLSQYKENLEKRYDKGENWYNLRPCSYDDLFEKEKIMYSTIAPEPRFIFDINKHYILDSGFIMTSETINLKFLIALLNSKLLFWYFKDICYSLSTKGFQFKKIFLEQLPIKLDRTYEKKITILTNKIIRLNELYISETNDFLKKLAINSHADNFSNKLENYFSLSENEFINEIKKLKIDLSDENLRNNLTNQFKISSKKINAINKEINDLEKEMNNLVFKLYNLNDKEIIIIENELK